MPARKDPAALVILVYKVPASKRERFLSFLPGAFKVYEEPKGVHVSLFEGIGEEGFFVEIVAYDTQEIFDADQERVEKDPRMRETLTRWRKFVEGEPRVLLVRNTKVDRAKASGKASRN
jgi:hypothetical protein